MALVVHAPEDCSGDDAARFYRGVLFGMLAVVPFWALVALLAAFML